MADEEDEVAKAEQLLKDWVGDTPLPRHEPPESYAEAHLRVQERLQRARETGQPIVFTPGRRRLIEPSPPTPANETGETPADERLPDLAPLLDKLTPTPQVGALPADELSASRRLAFEARQEARRRNNLGATESTPRHVVSPFVTTRDLEGRIQAPPYQEPSEKELALARDLKTKQQQRLEPAPTATASVTAKAEAGPLSSSEYPPRLRGLVTKLKEILPRSIIIGPWQEATDPSQPVVFPVLYQKLADRQFPIPDEAHLQAFIARSPHRDQIEKLYLRLKAAARIEARTQLGAWPARPTELAGPVPRSVEASTAPLSTPSAVEPPPPPAPVAEPTVPASLQADAAVPEVKPEEVEGLAGPPPGPGETAPESPLPTTKSSMSSSEAPAAAGEVAEAKTVAQARVDELTGQLSAVPELRIGTLAIDRRNPNRPLLVLPIDWQGRKLDLREDPKRPELKYQDLAAKLRESQSLEVTSNTDRYVELYKQLEMAVRARAQEMMATEAAGIRQQAPGGGETIDQPSPSGSGRAGARRETKGEAVRQEKRTPETAADPEQLKSQIEQQAKELKQAVKELSFGKLVVGNEVVFPVYWTDKNAPNAKPIALKPGQNITELLQGAGYSDNDTETIVNQYKAFEILASSLYAATRAQFTKPREGLLGRLLGGLFGRRR